MTPLLRPMERRKSPPRPKKAKRAKKIEQITAEVAADPHVQARKMLEYMDLGVPGLENVPLCGIPIQLSETPGSVREQAPSVGQHNDEFYKDLLGYDDDKLANLRESGMV